MLAVILSYHSFFEFLPYQIANLKKHIHVPFTIYLVDNSLSGSVKYSDPDLVYLHCNTDGSPSIRHQSAVNLGLSAAWESSDCFLIFDNDMIFLTPFKLPTKTQYLKQQRGDWIYGWLNLMFFYKDERLKSFDFATCPKTNQRTDSGGSFGHYLQTGDPCEEILCVVDPDVFPQFTQPYERLCKEYNVNLWYDIFVLNHSIIFHFRALSNWTKYPEAFQQEKKQLILNSVKA